MGARESYPAGTFCWVDLVATDADAAKEFYGELLGWEAPRGERYAHWTLGGRDVAGVYALPGAEPRWTSYVAVEDAAAAAAGAAAAGGSVVEPAASVGSGTRAVIADPLGTPLALWQAGEHPGARLVNDVGCWCSNQLQAPDPPLDFYREWLGWEVKAAGDGYWAVRNAGADNGGILTADGPPAWLVYFHVEDADDATRGAQAAGAAVLLAPETIGLGRIAILADPQGAAFGLFAGATDP